MRGRGRWNVVIASGLWWFTACDPVLVVSETDLFPELRRQLLEECCRCLADSRASPKQGRCQAPESEASDEGPAGAGIDIESSPCLCEDEPESCTDSLWAGETVILVGACTQAGGPCEEACGGVLAYP